MGKKFWILVLLFNLVFSETSHADEILNSSGVVNRKISVNPASQQEGFSAVMYDNTKGLPTSEANAIAETSEGFIWIGSYGGLVRYDGNVFERMPASTGISSVKCLYVDTDERLWVGTGDAGLFLIEKGIITHWNKADGLKSSSVIALAEDKNKNIFAATTSGIVKLDENLKLTNIDDERINNAYIRDIRLGSNNLLYGLTQTGDLFTLKDGKIQDFLSHEDCRIKGIFSILPDPYQEGSLWVGTDQPTVYHGNLKNNFENYGLRNIAPLSYVERFEYIDDKIWLCTGKGIGYLNDEGFFKLENIPMNTAIEHVMTDYEGNLWFTSNRHGVMKIVPNHFMNLYEKSKLNPAVVNSTCLFENKLFIATDSGLTVLDEDGEKINSLPLTDAETASGKNIFADDLINYLSGVRIRSLIRDKKNNLWISTWRKYGLLRYSKGKLTVFDTNEGLFSVRVRVVTELENGSILVANTGGVNIIDGDKITASYGAESGLTNTDILTVCEGFNHDYIIGTDGGGIFVLNKNGVKNISSEEGLTSDIVMRVKRARDKKIYWIVTSNSIAYMTEDYKVVTIKNFPYLNNYDIYENDSGYAWILASNGIYIASVEDLIKNENIEPVHFDINNGLPCTPTSNAYSELTDSGDIYIASLTGVVKVNINNTSHKNPDLKVSVPYIDVDGERIFPDENGKFKIPSNANKLTVSSFVFNYSLNNPMLSWQLEGFEKKGNAPIRRSDLVPVDYTNLRGGKYNFVIQIMDLMKNPYKKVSVQIEKEKAFYEELWFYLVMMLLSVVVLTESIGYHIRSKTLKLERQNKENMTFIKEITEAFAKVIDVKDSYTNGHSSRVAKYTSMLAEELGYDDDSVEKCYRIALLHDIGKIAIPSEVLNKPGKLTDEEFEIIKSHTSKGYDLLKDISIMPELATGARSHHERPDGKGYPNGLKGEEIPRVAQIIAVADAFDAMYSNRPYRNRMNFDKVVSVIKEAAGTQLTADVVEAFLRLVSKGKFRAPDDNGGGSLETIENIKNK